MYNTFNMHHHTSHTHSFAVQVIDTQGHTVYWCPSTTAGFPGRYREGHVVHCDS